MLYYRKPKLIAIISMGNCRYRKFVPTKLLVARENRFPRYWLGQQVAMIRPRWCSMTARLVLRTSFPLSFYANSKGASTLLRLKIPIRMQKKRLPLYVYFDDNFESDSWSRIEPQYRRPFIYLFTWVFNIILSVWEHKGMLKKSYSLSSPKIRDFFFFNF